MKINQLAVTVILLILVTLTSLSQGRSPGILLFSENDQTIAYIEITTNESLRKDIYDELICQENDGNICNPKKIEIGRLFIDGEPLETTETYKGIPFYIPIVVNDCDKYGTPGNLERQKCETGIASRKRFRIYLQDKNSFLDFKKKNYLIDFSDFTNEQNTRKRWHQSVASPVTRTISPSLLDCQSGPKFIGFLLKFEPLVEYQFNRIHKWINDELKQKPSNLKLEVQAKNANNKESVDVKRIFNISNKRPGTNTISFCVETKSILPDENFSAKITFSGSQAPIEFLQPSVVPGGIEGVKPAEVPNAKIDEKEVGARDLDKNLDIAVAVTSSVVEKEENGVKFRDRENKGVFDVRFVPFIINQNYKVNEKGTAIYSAFKPFYIDAKVSTDKITKETLSLNRIVIGTQWENRFYTNVNNPPTYYRFNYGVKNQSDRDFKQAEIVVNGEFRPVLKKFHRPISGNVKEIKDEITGDIRVIDGQNGYSIIPLFGVDFGAMWRRNNPAEIIKPGIPVFRGYFGLETSFNPNRFITFTVNNTLYVRSTWESKDDRLRNFFTGRVEFALGKSIRSPQSVFFAFERGDKPPFTETGVNVFKIGYRIRSDWWQIIP